MNSKTPHQLVGKSVESLTEMIAATPSCLKVINAKGELLNMNPQGIELIEACDLESVLNADVYSLVDSPHREKFKEFNERVCAGERGTLEFEIVGLKGTKRWMETYAAPLRLTNGEVAHIAITNDITERMEAQQQLLQQQQALASSARLASLGEFVGGVAHEINNPLAVILGKLTLLEMQLESDQLAKETLQQEIRKVVATTERISEIINNLKTFSRNSDDDAMERTPLKSVIDDTLSLCREHFRLNNIELNVLVDSALNLNCRKVQISQVLMNLLNNSFEAVKSLKTRWVSFEAEKVGQSIHLCITDSGSGVPVEVSQRMLDPFFTTKAVGEGTGLGLSISSSIVQNHGGNLRYNPNHANTQFVLEFPLS